METKNKEKGALLIIIGVFLFIAGMLTLNSSHTQTNRINEYNDEVRYQNERANQVIQDLRDEQNRRNEEYLKNHK